MINAFVQPSWSAPSHIKAYTSTRALQTELSDALPLPNTPIWLNQVHGNRVVEAKLCHLNTPADASFTSQTDQPCVIRTADCLPILLCDKAGTHVAAIHGGWRSLSTGIIKQTVEALGIPPESILAWLGPAISQMNYEIDDSVRSIFITQYPALEQAFIPSSPGHWFLDLYAIARLQLIDAGVRNITGGEYCTYRDSGQFFSYRREGADTGRMISIIWISRNN